MKDLRTLPEISAATKKEIRGTLIVSLVTFSIMAATTPLYYLQNKELFRVIYVCALPFVELWIWWALMKKYVWKF